MGSVFARAKGVQTVRIFGAAFRTHVPSVSMETVSIVIPAYNASAYLVEAVDCALAQTHRSCEVIVVDDGSTDETPEILRRYGAKVRAIRQPNSGSGAACNTGVKAAEGKWVAFLDADDLWAADKVSLQLTHCGESAISHTDSYCFGEAIPAEILRSSFETPYSGRVLANLLVRNFITKSSVMIRREVFLDCGGFDAAYPGVEDWPFWLKVCVDHDLAYLPEPVVRYRVHRKSKSMDGRKMMADHLRIIDEAFTPHGAGAQFPWLRPKALASSYQVNCHYAAESGDWSFAAHCAIKALQHEPAVVQHWKSLAKVLLIPFGVKY
jgi:glycosyltransferase involved in cell wall biosynthesis